MTDFGDEGEGVDVGNAAGYLAGFAREGRSANSAYRAFRESGGAMRRSTFLDLYSNVRDTLAREPVSSSLDPNALPEGTQYGEWAMGAGGQYATQVNILFRDRESGAIGRAPYTHISDDPHTPDEAIAAGIDLYTDDEAQQKYDQVILGGIATNVWRTIPFTST